LSPSPDVHVGDLLAAFWVMWVDISHPAGFCGGPSMAETGGGIKPGSDVRNLLAGKRFCASCLETEVSMRIVCKIRRPRRDKNLATAPPAAAQPTKWKEPDVAGGGARLTAEIFLPRPELGSYDGTRRRLRVLLGDCPDSCG
jgi:hypothetical protein